MQRFYAGYSLFLRIKKPDGKALSTLTLSG
jgi:hypothetical protein